MTNRAMESVGSIFHDAFTASPIGIVIENFNLARGPRTYSLN